MLIKRSQLICLILDGKFSNDNSEGKSNNFPNFDIILTQ